MIQNRKPHTQSRRLAIVSLQGMAGETIVTGDPQTPGTVDYRPPAEPAKKNTTVDLWQFMGRAASTLVVLSIGQNLLERIGKKTR